MDILNTNQTALKNAINAPYVYSEVSTLGGVSNASLIIKVSKDDKSQWANGILQNSNYAMFHISTSGDMELFSKQYTMPKFRKSKVNSIQDIVDKINNYLRLG
jgi:hypothetical protein